MWKWSKKLLKNQGLAWHLGIGWLVKPNIYPLSSAAQGHLKPACFRVLSSTLGRNYYIISDHFNRTAYLGLSTFSHGQGWVLGVEELGNISCSPSSSDGQKLGYMYLSSPLLGTESVETLSPGSCVLVAPGCPTSHFAASHSHQGPWPWPPVLISQPGWAWIKKERPQATLGFCCCCCWLHDFYHLLSWKQSEKDRKVYEFKTRLLFWSSAWFQQQAFQWSQCLRNALDPRLLALLLLSLCEKKIYL